LDLQSSHFKVTMMHNFEGILWEENNLNLITKLWHKITINPILNHKLSKFMKLVEIEIVQVFGLIEDKHILTLWTSWKIGCEINWTFTWIFAPTFSVYGFLIYRISLMIKPLPNGKAKSIIAQMCRCSLLLEVVGFFWKICGLQRKILLFLK